MQLPRFIGTGSAQDAYPDGPQSGREVQVVRLRRGPPGGAGHRPGLGGPGAPEEERPAVCSGCGRPGPAYDRLELRHFEFVPLWGIAVYLAYRMRRVDCRRCGVTVEMVPWGDGKNRLTTCYRWFLASWAKRLSGSEVASIFRTSWDSATSSSAPIRHFFLAPSSPSP